MTDLESNGALKQAVVRKYFRSFYRYTVLVLLVLMVSSCGKQSDTRVIKLANALSSSHPVTKAVNYLAKRVKEESGGKLQVKVYSGGQLGNEREALELLQIGSIGMSKVSAASLAGFAPEYKAVNMPYIFRNDSLRFKVLDSRIGKELLLGTEDIWLRGLCFYDAGKRSFYTVNKKVEKPEDLKGMKIRVMKSEIAVQMIRDMGGAAAPIPFGELYSALQQGVVDGAENNPPSLFFSRQYEVIDYYILDEHAAVPDVLVISTLLWNRLSPQEQQWLQQAAQESAVYQRKLWAQLEEKSIRKIRESGVKIIRPEKKLFREKVQPLYKKIKTNDPALYKRIEQIQQMQDSLVKREDS